MEVVEHGDTYDEAEAYGIEQTESGAQFVSAYNDPDVIAGQSTILAELFEQVPSLAAMVAPVGGGGLVAGIAFAAAQVRKVPRVDVHGVEAEMSRALSTAVAAGETVPIDVGPTLADGLAGNLEPGSVTVSDHRAVREEHRVDDEALRMQRGFSPTSMDLSPSLRGRRCRRHPKRPYVERLRGRRS